MTYFITTDNSSLKKLVAKGKYDYQYFASGYKLPEGQEAKVKIELVQVGHQSNNQAVVDAMAVKGYRMATFREALELCAKYPDLQNDKYIATVDKKSYLAFSRWGGRRGVRYRRFDFGWFAPWWFAGVRKSLDARSLGTSRVLELLAEAEKKIKQAKEVMR